MHVCVFTVCGVCVCACSCVCGVCVYACIRCGVLCVCVIYMWMCVVSVYVHVVCSVCVCRHVYVCLCCVLCIVCCVCGVVCVCMLYCMKMCSQRGRRGEGREVGDLCGWSWSPVPHQQWVILSHLKLHWVAVEEYIRSFQLSKVQLCRSYYMPKYRLHLLHWDWSVVHI